MPDVYIPEEHEDPSTSQKIGAKVAMLAEAGHELYAEAATGDKHGRTRRPTLYVIAATGVVISLVLDGIPGLIAGLVGLIAMLLLAMTDAVVEL